MSDTRVFTVDEADAHRLEDRLRRDLPPDAEWRRVDHARFAVKAEGVSLVCYVSGKVVVQGKSLEGYASRHLADLAHSQGGGGGPVKPDERLDFSAPTIGSDEAGKGDYFGPLVVAAVHVEPEQAKTMAAMRVADSKTISDLRMFPMAEHIERTLPCAVRSLMPSDYNSRWQQQRNVNHVLADLHADAIAALAEARADARIVVDRFGEPSLLEQRLRQRLGTVPPHLVQVPRAECHFAVAAASIVARVHFLEGLRRCQEDAGAELPKGAGDVVDRAAKGIYAVGGQALMRRIAKLHFKNSQRVGITS